MAQALAEGADTLITTGGVQSNHARATAAVAARMGLGCVLVANGTPPAKPTANALLDRLLGAEVRYVGSREARAPGMEDAAAELRKKGRRPFVIPLGASTPLGAAAYAMAVTELLAQIRAAGSDRAVDLVGRHAGGHHRGLPPARAVDPGPGHQRRRPVTAIAAEVRRILGGLEDAARHVGRLAHGCADRHRRPLRG